MCYSFPSRLRYYRHLGVKSIFNAENIEDFQVKNEPVLGYTQGSKERRVLESALEQYSKETVEVPIVIGGKEYKTDRVMYQPMVKKQNSAVLYSCSVCRL